MSPAAIIPAFDPLKYRKLSLLLICEGMAVDPLHFDGFEEALSHGIIPAVTFPAHTLDYKAVCLQDPGERITGVLDASIRVEYQLLGNRPVPDGHPPGRNNSFLSRQPLAHGPTDYSTIIEVDNYCQIQPTFLRSDIGDVRDPYLTWSGSVELLVQQVRCYRIIVLGVRCHFEPFWLSCSQLSSFHNLGYPVFGYCPAIYTKLFGDPWAAVGLIALVKDIHDLDQQLFILLPACRRSAAKPFVITGSAHLKYFAHHLNGKTGSVIAHKLVDFPSLLEKMLTAFFKMSLSILASRSSFRKRAFSLSRSVILGFPLPGKLLFSYFWYSLLQRYNNSGRIPNSSAISRALPLANDSSTAFCLNSQSYFCLSLVIMAIYYF